MTQIYICLLNPININKLSQSELQLKMFALSENTVALCLCANFVCCCKLLLKCPPFAVCHMAHATCHTPHATCSGIRKLAISPVSQQHVVRQHLPNVLSQKKLLHVAQGATPGAFLSASHFAPDAVGLGLSSCQKKKSK